jgi:tRNA (adenine37-N6)-methyltransferase
MEVTPIGVIHSPYSTRDECPIQPAFSEAHGSVEVFPEYAAGLKDVETFTHVYLLYEFNRAGDVELVRPTFLDDAPHGIFASRHPCRPNAIGMSIVRLLERRDNVLLVSGVDVLDRTPLLDIKPYMPRFDVVETASNGWADELPWRPKPGDRE